MERVLVVVPTYNERENVRPLLEELLAQGETIDVWVADDGSPDGTAIAVREVMAEAERLARSTVDERGR